MAYFLCVDNAHHWEKDNWYEGGDCQRQKFKNPEIFQAGTDLTEIEYFCNHSQNDHLQKQN